MDKTFIVTFDARYTTPGTFVWPMRSFLDPEQRFSVDHIQRIRRLDVGDSLDLADGRTVQRQA
jgi:hypothetical protein